jgi:hypothetical protein
MDIKCPNQVFYVRLVDLQNICAKYELETWCSPNNDIRTYLLDMKHSWAWNAFWDVNNKNDVNGESLLHISYLITLIAYLRSQRTQYVPINFFMFEWSMYSPFVPNNASKRDSLQKMIFENVFSTWSMVEVKSLFETWITRNDVNCVSLFHLSYLIILIIYLCSHWTSNLQIKYFMFDWSIYRLFVLNRGWKHDTLQILLFVYISSTWSLGKVKRVLRRE